VNSLATIRAYWSKDYLYHTLLGVETGKTLLAVIGALWLFVEVIDFFFPSAGVWCKSNWPYLAAVVPVVTLVLQKPLISIAHQISGRDVQIEVRIGDLLSMSGDLIITTNTTFDTDPSIIAPTSIQGQFTKKFYSGNYQHLDTDIGNALTGVTYETLYEQRKGKSNQYPIGTVAKISQNQRTFYLLASVHMNEHGNCNPATFEQIKVSLANLWAEIGCRGERGHLVMGIIGTGRGRLNVCRMDVARELVKSYIAACSECTFSDGLILMIHPSDYRKNDMNLRALGEFVRHECLYADLDGAKGNGRGTGIS
jgi:hypothetical protein